MCTKKQQPVDVAPVEVQYPRYISNHPKGEDLFEGKSQKRLAQAVAAHIVSTDKEEEKGNKPFFSRLLGLEGKWGSGKSNVIKILQDELKEKYTFFCFDAWGNQEDLQRRSILELLTKQLITEEKLTGETTMRVMKPEGEGKVEEIPCTWKEKLESLLSRKSYTRDITVPSLNAATKWFVLALLAVGLVIAYLAVNKTDIWWVDILIALSPLLIFTGWMFLTKQSWKKMFAMYNTEGKSDTTSYVISEQEPSVREFKEWMTEVSNGIPANDKLVLVFDNMDRLPMEKVHQLWSLIQTFFADDGYKNIWCIVPYDESHLAAVFSSNDQKNERITLLRGFLDKTFPVIYRVPEPIVADYKNIFEEFFRNAFDKTVDDDSLELISQCYRHVHPEPNVREIISFINSNVRLANQWKNSISPISRAIYILTENTILHKPQLPSGTEGELNTVSTDEYILANEYYKEFNQLLFGKVELNNMQREIAAMVYGVEPKNATQIVVKRYIRNCNSGTDKNGTLDRYADNPHFMLLLEDDVKNMPVNEYARAASLIQTIDEAKLSAKDKSRLANIWRHFGERFVALEAPVKEFTDFYQIVFGHVTPALAERCVATFSKRLIENSKEVDGALLYEQLTKLYSEPFSKDLDINKVCPASTIDAKRFADYVLKAGKDYKRYPLKADATELNQTFNKSIDKEFPYLEVLKLLKDDANYNVAEVGNYAVQQFNQKKASALLAQNLIAIQRVFYSTFQSVQDANYNTTLWQEVQTEEGKRAYDEIFALKSIGVYENLPEDERHINMLMPRVLFYTSTTKLFKDYLANLNIHFRRNLLKKMVETKKHDSTPDYPEFIEHWQEFVSNLGVQRKSIIQFADDWGYKHISEPEQAKSYFTLLSDIAWIDELLAADTSLAKELMEKCVANMIAQPQTQFAAANTANHTGNNWDVALKKLVFSPYITSGNMGNLNLLAVQLLDAVARTGVTLDETWNSLLQKVDYANVSASVVELRNKILNGQSDYAIIPAKFKTLHKWLRLSDILTRRDDAANQILAKVIDDSECQAIIMADKEYYAPMISETIGTASVLHTKLKKILAEQGETEFAKYVRGLVNYEEGDKAQ